MGRWWTRPQAVVLLVVILGAGGCAASETEGSIGAGVMLGIYQRSTSPDPMGHRLDSAGNSHWGAIGVYDRGCSAATVPWTISIGAAGPDGAVGEYTELLSSADVDDPRSAVIWIDVAKDGRATWGEGRPDWADSGLTCGS